MSRYNTIYVHFERYLLHNSDGHVAKASCAFIQEYLQAEMPWFHECHWLGVVRLVGDPRFRYQDDTSNVYLVPITLAVKLI